jgi:hypothetical protein
MSILIIKNWKKRRHKRRIQSYSLIVMIVIGFVFSAVHYITWLYHSYVREKKIKLFLDTIPLDNP